MAHTSHDGCAVSRTIAIGAVRLSRVSLVDVTQARWHHVGNVACAYPCVARVNMHDTFMSHVNQTGTIQKRDNLKISFS
jgi:hypothetical protein